MKFTETIPKQYFYSIETTWLYKVYLFSLVHPHIWTSSNEHAFRDGQKPFLRTISSIAISPWKLLPQTPSNTTCSENKQPNLMKGFFFFFGMLPLGYCYPAEVSKAPNLKKKKKMTSEGNSPPLLLPGPILTVRLLKFTFKNL